MSDKKDTSIKFLLPESNINRDGSRVKVGRTLPKALGGSFSRSGSGDDHNPFINERSLQVESVFDITGAGRSGKTKTKGQEVVSRRLIALEAADGSTIFVRADKLKEDLERLYPDTALTEDGVVNLQVLTDSEAAARGIGDWIWSRLTLLDLQPDGLVEAAKDKALELLKEKLGEQYAELLAAGASWAGAKALMWAIESRLVGEPGLYHWHERDLSIDDRVDAEDSSLKKAAEDQEPILLFIHGVASSTVSGFGGLHEGTDEGCWENLTSSFAGRVYGFEHRTFSSSPLENALLLANSLPRGSRLSLITHSSGGLIGDLLCSGDFDEDLVSRYQREPILETEGEFKGRERPENKKLREVIVAEEKDQLRTLRKILKEKKFVIDRYVRVASPASGTTLLLDNFDLFLSGLLSLFNTLVGLIPAVGTMGSTVLSALRRIVLEVAEKRIDPHLIPGIEAMLPNSPLTIFLAQAPRKEPIQMAVIAGNTDGDSGGYLKRIAVMLTDWIIFDHFDNDFVVDTQSMRAGLARRNETREYYAHNHLINHLRYFERPDTRRAIYKWITSEQPGELEIFHPIPTDCDLKLDDFGNEASADHRSAEGGSDKPIVIYLPGVMGSHLEIRKANRGEGEGDRVWFDPFHLTTGGIAQLSMEKDNVLPEGLFRRYYGELEAFLKQGNEVITFAYDWRKAISDTANELADLLNKQLDAIKEQPHRQLSILAHSMGGLVVRTLIAEHKALWERVVSQTGGYFVMLGTPNHGSHKMVENLMGKGRAVRHLAMLDFQHDLQEIVDIIANYDGILQLLPPEGFQDVGVENLAEGQVGLNYLAQNTWETIRTTNRDRWFSDGVAATLNDPVHKVRLEAAEKLWERLNAQDELGGIPHADRIAYVFGLDAHTPCGVALDKARDRLNLFGTAEGDGSVSWKSGALACLTHDRYWYMPVSHPDLTRSEKYFPAIAELLHKGGTRQLEQKAPRTRSVATRSYTYDAGPSLQPGAEDLALSFFGGRPIRGSGEDSLQPLAVGVKAMDLRFAQHPVMCGHYVGDSIAGAEFLIDKLLLNGALTQRERLGVYAGDLGSNVVVLNPQTPEERKRGSGQGAIIVGLGEWNHITVQALTNTVRDGVLQYLLHSSECVQQSDEETQKAETLTINSLLIGYNSTTHITVEASIEAIVLGVCEANQQYRYNKSKKQRGRSISRLEFIEYYLDTAISAAYAVRDLPRRLEKDLKRLDARVVPEIELQFGAGSRERLSERSQASGYWSRLMVTDADQEDERCPETCFEHWLKPNIPKRVVDAVKSQLGTQERDEAGQIEKRMVLAERLKYVYLSERARAEAMVQQRQPGLIEALINDAIQCSDYDRNVCRTLFQLMVPVDFKAAARETHRLLLVLDGYTANLPWEMLQADEEPLALKIAMVRQLVSSRFRKSVTGSLNKTACVIGNPATTDFFRYFDVPGVPVKSDEPQNLISLKGATAEAIKVAEVLKAQKYQVETLYPQQPEDPASHSAIDVFNILFKKPYRILMIAAHGEVNVISKRDGKARTGVVLSDGVMLTAAEIGQMEVVPDLVFLNCCHLAKIDNTAQGNTGSYNRLAYSVARELIEMGVRCVIAAGWGVDDDAAKTFSTRFFELFTEGETFGLAVWKARKRTHEMHPGLNTWGAYQAYGDPNFVLHAEKEEETDTETWTPVAPQELKSELEKLQVNSKRSLATADAWSCDQLVSEVERHLKRVPPDWVSNPGIQYQLAELYGDMLPDGFDRAVEACQRAILEDDKKGHVPIKALELMGNLEARQAEKLSEQAEEIKISSQQADISKEKKLSLIDEREHLLDGALKLVDSAIKRLHGLLKITHEMNVVSGQDNSNFFKINAERYALLGGAYKRKAMVLIRRDQCDWDDVKDSLEQCRDFYQKGEGVSFDLSFNPYAIINRLQLDGLLATEQNTTDPAWLKPRIELAKKAQAAARRTFNRSLQFFDGVMAADALVALYLLNDQDLMVGEKDDPKTMLVDAYTGSVKGIHYSTTEMDSVTRQLECLSIFMQIREAQDSDWRKKSGLLRSVATVLNKS